MLSVLAYVAIEPFLRRTWPEVLTSWARLVSGAVRDPLLGRDMLAGGLLGAIDALLVHLRHSAAVWFHIPGQIGIAADLSLARIFVGILSNQLNDAAQSALYPMLILFLLRITLKRAWLVQFAEA